MKADELIERYVADVARHLSRAQRNDVAVELRALLNEELRAREGGAADDVAAAEMLRSFGRPRDVALRYRPPLTIIDPADSRDFVRLSTLGVASAWILGLVLVTNRPIGSMGDLLTALGRWWIAAALPSLGWPGFLVVCYGFAAAARRRWPRMDAWDLKDVDRDRVNRVGLAIAIFAAVFGLFLLIHPAWMLDVVFAGRAAPSAYDALTYDDAFVSRRAPWLLACIVAQQLLWVAVLVRGRWLALTRSIDVVLSGVICGLLIWIIAGDRVFTADRTDGFLKLLVGVIVLFTLFGIGGKLRRGVRPARVSDDWVTTSSR